MRATYRYFDSIWGLVACIVGIVTTATGVTELFVFMLLDTPDGFNKKTPGSLDGLKKKNSSLKSATPIRSVRTITITLAARVCIVHLRRIKLVLLTSSSISHLPLADWLYRRRP